MIDEDVKRMTPGELRREVMRLRRAFRKELAHTGNHRCWVNLLEAVDGQRVQPIDIPRDRFIANCGRYYDRNAPCPAKKTPK